jgi:hypothetical protein
MADQNHTGPPPWTCCFTSATMTTCGSTPRRSGRPSASGREAAVAMFSYATCSACPPCGRLVPLRGRRRP